MCVCERSSMHIPLVKLGGRCEGSGQYRDQSSGVDPATLTWGCKYGHIGWEGWRECTCTQTAKTGPRSHHESRDRIHVS